MQSEKKDNAVRIHGAKKIKLECDVNITLSKWLLLLLLLFKSFFSVSVILKRSKRIHRFKKMLNEHCNAVT